MKIRSRLSRVVVSLTAAAATIAMTAPGVGAAGEGPPVFAGEAEALALNLRLSAPSAVLGAVTDGSNTLQQKVSFTTSKLNSDGVADAVTRLLEGLLNQGHLSSEGGQTTGSQAIADQDVAGVLQVGAGKTNFTADAAQNLSESFSELANLRVTLRPLFDSGQVPEHITGTVQDSVRQVTETVNSLIPVLESTLNNVEQTLEDTTGQIVKLPDVTPEQLPRVPDITQVDILSVRKIWSTSTVTTVDDLVTSAAESGIVNASLLGGLIEVPTFQYTSRAQTAGTPGTADAGTKVTDIAVRVAGSDVIRVEGSKLTVGDTTIDLNDPAFEGVPLNEVLGPVQGVLQDILSTVGLSVSPGEGTTNIAPDGSSASATTSAFAIRLTPLHAAGADDVLDLNLELLPTRAAVSAGPEQVQAPAPPPSEPALPRTGGGAAAMLLGALALGGAGILRFKR